MRDSSPDAALFSALVGARPPPIQAGTDEMAVLVLRLADSVRHGASILREAAAALTEPRGLARLPALLAEAEAVSLEQAQCARGLLEGLSRPDARRAA